MNHLVQLWLTNGMVGRAHGVRPHVTITTSVDDLDAGFPGEMTVPGCRPRCWSTPRPCAGCCATPSVTEIGVVGSVPDRHAHHHDGIPCHGAAHQPPRRPTAHGHVHGVAGCELNADSARLLRRRHHVWDEGRRYRTVPPRLRRALDLRDRHCAFPGCRIAVGWCEAHHILEWEHGGATNLDNLTLVVREASPRRARRRLDHRRGFPGIDPGCPTWLTFTPPDPVPPRTRP